MKITEGTHRGVNVWILDHSVDGKRSRKYCKTEAEAREEAQKLQKNERRFGAVLASLSPRQRADIIYAVQKLSEHGATVVDAANYWIEHHSGGLSPTVAVTTIDAFRDFMMVKKAAGIRPRTEQQYNHSLGRFAEAHANIPVTALALSDVDAWLKSRDVSLITRKSLLTDIKTLFRWMLKRELITKNPLEAAEKIKVQTPQAKPFTPEEAKRLLSAARAADPALLPWLALSLFSGIRPAEMRGVTWDVVDLEAGTVIVDSIFAKTRTRRPVTIHATAIEWLRLGGDLPPINLIRRLGRVRKEAKVPWPHDVLRKTAASYSLAMTENVAAVSRSLGHTADVLITNYAAIVKKSDAEAFFKLTPSVVPAKSGAFEPPRHRRRRTSCIAGGAPSPRPESSP